MRKIYKYELTGEKTTLQIPEWSTILSCQIQYDSIVIWALVDLDQLNVSRTFMLLLTGQDVPHLKLSFVATLQYTGYVYHVFEQLDL